MIQIGGVHSTFCQEEGILLPKYRDRNGRCIAILFKSIGVRGRCGSPDVYHPQDYTGDVHHGFRGGGARIVGLENVSPTTLSCSLGRPT